MINLKNFRIEQTLFDSLNFSIIKARNKKDNKILYAKIIKTKITDEEKIISDLEKFMTFHHPSFLTFFGFSKVDFYGNSYLTILCQSLSDNKCLLSFDEIKKKDNYFEEFKNRIYMICQSLVNYFQMRKLSLVDLSMNELLFDIENKCFLYTIFPLFTDIINNSSDILTNIQSELNISNVIDVDDDELKQKIFLLLTDDDKRHIQKALDGDVDRSLKIGKCFYFGTKNFPKNEEEGVHLIKYAADNGNIKAQLFLSKILFDELPSKSYEYCLMAAKHNDIEAILMLGILLLKGHGIKQNINSAGECFKIVAENDNIQGIMNYAWFLLNISKTERDVELAAEYYKKAADKGVSEAMIYFADICYTNSKLDKNKDCSIKLIENAKKYYLMAFLSGNNEACIKYFDNVHDENSISLLHKAADNGYLPAITKYAFIMTENNCNEEALKYFKIAAKNFDDTNSFYNIATMLIQGKGIKKDIRKAIKYYNKGIAKGDTQAMISMAELYESDIDELRSDNNLSNIKEAKKLYLMAAQLGNSDGMFNYARIVEEYENDLITAALFYKNAADNENSDGMYRLAVLLDKCGGDPKEIIYYGNKSVEYGNPNGMLFMGMLSATGKYFEKNIEEARNLFIMAEENGLEDDIDYSLILDQFCL